MSTRKTISQVDPSKAVVNEFGFMTEAFKLFVLQLVNGGLIIDTGSPEGVIEAQQGAIYMDDTGTAGSILYIKRDADISGDKTKGWILV